MLVRLTSRNGGTVGSGSVVNEVTFVFNDFAQLSTEYQSHSGAVNTGTTPKVQYDYVSGSANTIRPTTMTYPDGRVMTYDYGSSGGNNDAASRIASLVDDDGGSTHLADYSYLGLGAFVEVDYTEPDVKYTLVGTAGGNDPDTGDIYRGLDRFGRIKDSYWYNYGTSGDADRIKYGYDRSGNRLWREKTVATSLSKYFDELYGYDRVDRLQDMERGRLAALKDSISSLQFAQDWSLDATGNWKTFREDDDGAGWDLDQTRTANKVNEITDISETTGPSWVTPVYNRAGNMTTIPRPADPTASFAATYDAWNRLVGISSSGATVAGYEYDGATRRIIKKSYTSGTLTETRHAYFTDPSKWQVIEERVDSSSSAERQFVWGLRYIDDLVLRDRDTNGNGTLDERLYGMQDANWNVTGLVSTSGTVQERYAYSAYGKPMFLDASFGSRSSSSFAWEQLFAGYVWDADVEWYAVRNRVYVVGLGWVQRDPIWHVDRASLYTYCDTRPVLRIDAFGLTDFVLPSAAIGACTGATAGTCLVVVAGAVVAILIIGAVYYYLTATASECVIYTTTSWWELYPTKIDVINAIKNRTGGTCEFYLAWCLWGTLDVASNFPTAHPYWSGNDVEACWHCYERCYASGMVWPFNEYTCFARFDQGPEGGAWPDQLPAKPWG